MPRLEILAEPINLVHTRVIAVIAIVLEERSNLVTCEVKILIVSTLVSMVVSVAIGITRMRKFPFCYDFVAYDLV